MSEWWDGLSTILKVLYCIALPSTLILILQTFLTMLGAHSGAESNFSDTSGLDLDTPADTDGHFFDFGHGDHDINDANYSDFGTLRLFTLQTIVAFFTVFSWSSIVLVGSDVPNSISIAVGFVLGFCVMVVIAKLVQLLRKLTENGTVNLNNAIGENAVVYIPCPPENEGIGKVTATIQGQLMELTAISTEKETLKTGTQVRIVDLRGDNVVIEKETKE